MHVLPWQLRPAALAPPRPRELSAGKREFACSGNLEAQRSRKVDPDVTTRFGYAMTEPKRPIGQFLSHLPRLLLSAAVLYFLLTGNADKILRLIPAHMHILICLWGLFFLSAAAWNLLQPRWERNFLGGAAKCPFTLEPGEVLLFSNYWAAGVLHLRAEDCNPKVTIRRVASKEKGQLGNRNLRLWLTDRRLILQSRQWRNTWRIIPIPSIKWIQEAPRRFFSPERLVIAYENEGRSEALVLEDKSLTGRTLKEGLLAMSALSNKWRGSTPVGP